MIGLRRIAKHGWTELSRLGISPASGFIPAKQPRFETNIEGVRKLVEVVKRVTSPEDILSEVPKLPMVDVGQLEKAEYEHVFLLLQLAVQKYYLALTTEEARVVPENLSVPFKNLSSVLNRLPVLQIASLQYHNWRLLDSSQGFSAENIEVPYLLTGTKDEAWFYIAATISDYRGAPILSKLCDYIQSPSDETKAGVLRSIVECLPEMRNGLKYIRSGVNPQVFYDKVRMMLKDYTYKVIFEGVSTEPEYYPGPSAIQSPMLRLINLLLGLQLDTPEMLSAERHMMKPHRDLLEAVKVLDFSSRILESHRKLYEDCLYQMKQFRFYHYGLVKDYIIRRGTDTKGTGGTELDKFLNKMIQDTSNMAKLIQSPGWQPYRLIK